jgi:hypothetical protein
MSSRMGRADAALLSRGVVCQNLVSNPTFDANLGGWSDLGTGSSSRNTTSGSPTVPIGAAQLILTDPSGNGTSFDIVQCIAIGSGPYNFGGRSYIVSSTAGSKTFIILELYPMAGCAGSSTSVIADETGTVAGQANGANVTYTQHTKANVSTGGAASVRVLVQVQTGGAASGAESITGLFDSIYVQCSSDVSAPGVTAPASVNVSQTVCS